MFCHFNGRQTASLLVHEPMRTWSRGVRAWCGTKH